MVIYSGFTHEKMVDLSIVRPWGAPWVPLGRVSLESKDLVLAAHVALKSIPTEAAVDV